MVFLHFQNFSIIHEKRDCPSHNNRENITMRLITLSLRNYCLGIKKLLQSNFFGYGKDRLVGKHLGLKIHKEEDFPFIFLKQERK